MDIQQLKFFITTAEYEHLSHAAEMLNISQSSLSYSINQLESELGVSLFDRIGRNIRLNNAGITFKQYAVEILHLVNEAKDTLNTQYGEESRSIIIQTSPISFYKGLFDLLYATEQNIEITPIAADTPSVLANNLLQLNTDMCITSFELPETGLNSITLHSDEIVALVSDNHPLAGNHFISVDTLKKQQFISSGTAITALHLDRIAKAINFDPDIKSKTVSHEETVYLLKKLPYMYLTSKVVYEHIRNIFDCSNIHMLELDTPEKILDRKLYWRKKNNPPAVKKLCDALLTYFK